MSETNFRKLTGIFFIVGALLVNVPYTLLMVNFDYPDILRWPPPKSSRDFTPVATRSSTPGWR